MGLLNTDFHENINREQKSFNNWSELSFGTLKEDQINIYLDMALISIIYLYCLCLNDFVAQVFISRVGGSIPQ